MVLIIENYIYPTTDEREYIVVPKSTPVILLCERKLDTGSDYEHYFDIFIFTGKDGWKKVRAL